jgi:site-specific recombinase XerD
VLIKKFLAAKKTSGCTNRTIKYYNGQIKFILNTINKTVDDITADDITLYTAQRLVKDKVSKTSAGNEQRVISSFLGWLFKEEYIKHNPMAKVDRMKNVKTKKKALTEMEVERIRDACENNKDKAVIELLLSTGCRVSELVNIKLDDIEGERILVHGKGEKDRYVYINAKAHVALEKYLAERNDANPYLFAKMVSIESTSKQGISRRMYDKWYTKPEMVDTSQPMGAGTVEFRLRKMSKELGIEIYPHKFRRTCATMALRRGMPIEQVSRMLGHEHLDTTKIYLDLNENELEQAHRKYVL